MIIKPTLSQSCPMHWIKFNPDKNQEIAMNSARRIMFMSWKHESSQFEYYSPSLSGTDSKGSEPIRFTKTVFIPKSQMAVTGTCIGDILVFDRSLIIEGIGDADQKRLIKIVTLTSKTSINQLMTIGDKYLVVGNSDGNIRFYDQKFKVAAWFENLNLNAIKSISFSTKAPEPASDDPMDEKDGFACSDFIVADSSAMIVQIKSRIFEAIETNKDKGETLMHGFKSSISAIAVHPKKPILAIAGTEGSIILYDYKKKAEIAYQLTNYDKDSKGTDGKGKNDEASKKHLTVMEFTPDGSELLIGQKNGKIQVVDPVTAKYKKLTQELRVSYDKEPAVKHLVVSEDGMYFATSDIENTVCLFKKDQP